MRSAASSLRGAGGGVFAPPASTGVPRCRPFAGLEVSCCTAVARRSGARALLAPRGGVAGWGGVLSAPGAGVVACWQPKR